jgi:dihydroneopterin aldolase
MFEPTGQAYLSTTEVDTPGSPPYTRIILQNVEVTARVGLAPWEQQRSQRLIVNIELYTASQDYLGDVTSDSIIDYCPLYERIQSWQTREHTDLIETLASDLLNACFVCPQVAACKVSVTKPTVFDQARGAGIEVLMDRRDYERSSGFRRAKRFERDGCAAVGVP